MRLICCTNRDKKCLSTKCSYKRPIFIEHAFITNVIDIVSDIIDRKGCFDAACAYRSSRSLNIKFIAEKDDRNAD